mmetsp:Transcript_4281/g.8168  ORF Transcript_4281/g.8168 Transcript_4281/m.8168 type:complete len:590 (+) Transcript_4281:168-1937(+)
MGASGSVAQKSTSGSLFYDTSPSQTPSRTGRPSPSLYKNSGFASLRGKPRAISDSSGGGVGLPSKIGGMTRSSGGSNPSDQEKVQDLVRKEVVKRILAGQSLMVPSPPVIDSSNDQTSSKARSKVEDELRTFRCTLFDHVAKPSPLPPNLCEDDVKDFKSISVWEEHLRQIRPWQDNQLSEKVSLINGIQTEQVMKRRSDPTGLASHGGSRQPIQAFRSPRTASPSPDNPVIEPQVSHPPSDHKITNAALLDLVGSRPAGFPPHRQKRGATFVSLPVTKKQEHRRNSVHKPDVQKCIAGLGFLLSYLVQEPPEAYVKNQSWDIFSVPGDKTKVRKPVNPRERRENAGSAVVEASDVDSFLSNLYKICQWTSECHIIAFILMIRLVKTSEGKIVLHRYNWQCMLVVSLMVTQKLWDDVSLNNVDFPQVWRMVAPNGGEMDLKDVNFMEREFLSILGYSVGVNMRTYTNVYYDVMALAAVNSSVSDVAVLPRGGGLAAAMNKFTKNSFHVLTNNVDKDLDEYGDGVDLRESEEKTSDASEASDDDDDDIGALGEDRILDNSRKWAHVKYNRRNTVDVLSKTPPRKTRGLVS